MDEDRLMTRILDRLYWLSRIAALILYGRKHMSLCAKAHEDSIRQRSKCDAERVWDRIFWFDPDHCKVSYIYYRLDRRNRMEKTHGHSDLT